MYGLNYQELIIKLKRDFDHRDKNYPREENLILS